MNSDMWLLTASDDVMSACTGAGILRGIGGRSGLRIS